MKKTTLIVCVLLINLSAFAAKEGHHTTDLQDKRHYVAFPEPIKIAMLERMRRHLSNINEIHMALAESNFERIADIAEHSLGLSSLGPHNTRQAAHMPQPMQDLGYQMHAASSRMAQAAQEADFTKTLQALSQVTTQCVACHATYRVH